MHSGLASSHWTFWLTLALKINPSVQLCFFGLLCLIVSLPACLGTHHPNRCCSHAWFRTVLCSRWPSLPTVLPTHSASCKLLPRLLSLEPLCFGLSLPEMTFPEFLLHLTASHLMYIRQDLTSIQVLSLPSLAIVLSVSHCSIISPGQSLQSSQPIG